ncbi:tetratricopeptide repeat protein [Aquirufa sp. HETE-40SA]
MKIYAFVSIFTLFSLVSNAQSTNSQTAKSLNDSLKIASSYYYSKNFDEAFHIYNSVDQRQLDSVSKFQLGMMYLNGKGPAKSIIKAINLFEELANQGDALGMKMLGFIYRDKDSGFNNIDKSISWFEKGALKNGYTSMYILGAGYFNGDWGPENFEKGAYWLGKFVNGANISNFKDEISSAYIYLARAHYFGFTGQFKNIYTAKYYWEKAADLGSGLAMQNLGTCYFLGEGVPINYQKARQYYENAVNAGNIDANFDLGALYLEGKGVVKNLEIAASYFEKTHIKNSDAILAEIRKTLESNRQKKDIANLVKQLKVLDLRTVNENQLLMSLQGEHALDGGGWININGRDFKAIVTWKRKDKMLGFSTGRAKGNPFNLNDVYNAKPVYDTYQATIKGTFEIEEIKQYRNLDRDITDKYGDIIGKNQRGDVSGFLLKFHGVSNQNQNYNFVLLVSQFLEITDKKMGKWRVGSTDDFYEKGTNEIWLSFEIDNYYRVK